MRGKGFSKWYGLVRVMSLCMLIVLTWLAIRVCRLGQSSQLSSKPVVEPTFECSTLTFDAQGRVVSRRKGHITYFTEDLGNNVKLDMVAIPGGTFQMGISNEESVQLNQEVERSFPQWTKNYREEIINTWIQSESPRHQVTISSFFMGKFEVTQAQWRAIANLPKVNLDLDPSPSFFKGGNLPVEQVSYVGAVEFCARLSRKTGKLYRLPTEAEWEYACRSGTTTPFAFGATITSQVVNYNGKSPYASAPKSFNRKQTMPVGSLREANAFGLYDMHGNVSEWCLDAWHKNYQGAPADGSEWKRTNREQFISPLFTIRGGAYESPASECRSAHRRSGPAMIVDNSGRISSILPDFPIGFRVIITQQNPEHLYSRLPPFH